MPPLQENQVQGSYLQVYKGFMTHLNFNKDEQFIKECLSAKYELPELSVISYKRIGEALSAIHEYNTFNNNIEP